MWLRSAASLHTLCLIGSLFIVHARLMPAQEETPEARQYREDYERIQGVVAISDLQRRANELYRFLKERPGSKVEDYAMSNYLLILDSLLKGEKYEPLLEESERFVKLRPKVGEGYYFYGAALRHNQRFEEAMDALAVCYVLKNPASAKARQFLEFIYKTQNRGSLIGVEKIIQKAQKRPQG